MTTGARSRKGRAVDVRAVTAVVVSAALTACSSSGAGSGARHPSSDAKAGGTLTVAITAPGSIDPGNAYDPVGNLVISTMCDALWGFDPLTGEPKSSLASNVVVSGSGRRITVQLRKHARFSDGRPVNADAVAYSLSRVASQTNASLVAGLLAPIQGYATVHGDTDTDDQQRRTQLSGVKVISSNSLQIDLSVEDADFVRVLGHPLASPVEKRAVAAGGASFASNPVCAGPYRLDRPYHDGDPTITLSRTPHYRAGGAAHTIGGRGWADHIVFAVEPDAASVARAYEQGKVDMAVVDEATAAGLRSDPDLVNTPSGSVEYVGVSEGTTSSVLASPNVRVALSQALDRTALVAAAFAGQRRPATGFLAPTLGRGFNPSGCGAATPATANVAGAQATLGRAATLNGQHVKLFFNDEFGHRAMAEAVAAQWRAAFGLVTDLQPMPWDQYLATATSPSGFSGAFREGWVAPYASADQYVTPLFGSEGIGRDNFAHYSDGALDLSIARTARREPTDLVRGRDYLRIEQQLCRAMPMIPIAFGQTHALVRRARLGSATSSFTRVTDGGLDLREVFVR